jgi:hypothetical protein
MIEDFFHLPLVSTTPVVHLELQTALVSKVHFYNNMYRTQERLISHELKSISREMPYILNIWELTQLRIYKMSFNAINFLIG